MLLKFILDHDRGRSHPLPCRLAVVGTPNRITDGPARVSEIMAGLVDLRLQ